MSYIVKLVPTESLMDEPPVQIPYDLFRLFVHTDELTIIAESLGYSRLGELNRDTSLRFYSGTREGIPCVAIGTYPETDYHAFLVDDMERPFSNKNMFYWCGLCLTESYIYKTKLEDGEVQVTHVVEWEDEDRQGKGKDLTFSSAVKEAMIEQMNLKPVSKPKTRKRPARRTK